MVIPDGLEGGFCNTQTIHPSFQHELHRIKLFRLDRSDGTGWLDFQGELTAAAQIESELQRKAGKNRRCRDRQRKDEGKPALLTGHRSEPLANDGLCCFNNLVRLNDREIFKIAVVRRWDVLARKADRSGVKIIETMLGDQSD